MLITVDLQSRNIRSEKIDCHWSTTKVKKSVEVKMDRATRLKLREQRITYLFGKCEGKLKRKIFQIKLYQKSVR